MKKVLLFLCLCLTFLCSGCNKDNESNKRSEGNINMENAQNKNIPSEDIPAADADSINKTKSSISQNEIENTDLVESSIGVLSSSELTITYKNKTTNILSYGKGYILQIENEEEWIDIPTVTGIGWKDVSLNLEADGIFEDVINLNQLFGELKGGHYRIIKEMSMETSKIKVTAEFDIE